MSEFLQVMGFLPCIGLIGGAVTSVLRLFFTVQKLKTELALYPKWHRELMRRVFDLEHPKDK